MASTRKQIEAIPTSYPVVAQYAHRGGAMWESDDETNTVDSDALWQRIEAYTAHRFTEREVIFIVDGPGEWNAPLTPATITKTEIWNGIGWEIITAPDAPLGGYWLSGDGPYRFTATVGGGDVPAAVSEAYRRLYEYSKGIANQFRGDAAFTAGDGGQTYAWTAKAIQLSGAADLLRPYRRA